VRRRARPSSGRRTGPEPAVARGRPRGEAAAPEVDIEAVIRRGAAALELDLPAGFPAQAGTYLDELERWERIGALTAYRDRVSRIRHLLLESLMLLAVLPEPATPLLDIGSGPGIPGLILKLARPAWEVVLIEAARRRANFLRHVVRRLGLTAVTIQWGRAEDLAAGALAGRFRTVTMRAVAPGQAAGALAAPFLAPGGVLVRPLGPRAGPSPGGTRREVVLALAGELPWRRQFLIIRQTELDADVSRGT
jgi:16S rRNA (guanine527-N7)-methyltransferase